MKNGFYDQIKIAGRGEIFNSNYWDGVQKIEELKSYYKKLGKRLKNE